MGLVKKKDLIRHPGRHRTETPSHLERKVVQERRQGANRDLSSYRKQKVTKKSI